MATPSDGRELNACGIIATMHIQTCTFDRARAIGFRLLFARASLLPAAAHAEWITRNESIMGTRCAVELWSEDRAKGEAAITSVFDDMKRIDRLMSTWKEDTEISQVNREGGKHPVKISQELFRLLQVSVEYSELTHGAFDITYASVGYLYDFKKGVHPDQKAIDAALPGINWRHMVLDAKNTRCSSRAPACASTSAASPRAIRWIAASRSCRSRASRAPWSTPGGDTRIIGDRFGKPWVVGVRDPDHEGKVFLRLPLTDTAFSTSGDYERYFDEDGKRFHHIIDPKTGDSARKVPQRDGHQRHGHAHRRADQERVHHGRGRGHRVHQHAAGRGCRGRGAGWQGDSIRRGWRRPNSSGKSGALSGCASVGCGCGTQCSTQSEQGRHSMTARTIVMFVRAHRGTVWLAACSRAVHADTGAYLAAAGSRRVFRPPQGRLPHALRTRDRSKQIRKHARTRACLRGSGRAGAGDRWRDRRAGHGSDALPARWRWRAPTCRSSPTSGA